MARRIRVQFPGVIYHIMSRGDRREAIFLDDIDRRDFLKTLAECCRKTDFRVHAYCLMSNHFHLVLETPEPNLVDGMRWLLSSYTIRLNHRHKLFGHVLSGRYKAVVVQQEGGDYFRTACDYVHLNPVRTQLLNSAERMPDSSKTLPRERQTVGYLAKKLAKPKPPRQRQRFLDSIGSMLRRLFTLVTALLFSIVTYSQGYVLFANRVVEDGLDAPVFLAGTQQGPGPGYTVQLWLASNGSLTPLLPTSTFYAPGSGADGTLDRYWIPQTVELPGIMPGYDAVVVVRTWLTSYGSFAAAQNSVHLGWGESTPIIATAGTLQGPGSLVRFQNFNVSVWPEPSSVVLGLVGGSILLFWRRRGTEH